MKRHNIITLILFVYLGIMAFIGRGMVTEDKDYLNYFTLLGVTVIIILYLRNIVKKRGSDSDNY